MTAMLSSRPGPVIRRIAIVSHSATILADRFGGLIDDLRANGHAVLCLVPDSAEPAASGISQRWRQLCVETAGIPFSAEQRMWSDFSTNRALAAQFRAWRPHAAIAMGHKFGPMAATAAKAAGAMPVLLAASRLGGAEQELGRLTSLRKALQSGVTMLCWNADDARVVRETTGGSVVQMAPAGLDVERLRAQTLPAIGGGFVFAMAAQFAADQGIEAYCAAARAVRVRSPQTRFVLFSPDNATQKPAIKAVLAAATGCVEVLDVSADMSVVLAAAHVAVSVPVRDGLLIPAQTAMALGRPLIVSDAPDIRDLVDESVNGHRVAAGDAEALAEAMMAILRRKDLVPAMGRASRAKVERNYDRRLLLPPLYAALGMAATAAGKAA